jgi:acetylornithine deacetylase
MDMREQRIQEEADRLSDDILDFACRLVRQPSTLLHETPALSVLEEELRRLSLSPGRVDMASLKDAGHPGYAPTPWEDAGRYNVVCVCPADGNRGRSALFNGHIDVVSPEPADLWLTDPFTPVVRDGWLHGRGSGDMKSGVAAMVYALHAVKKAGFGLKGPVTLEGVIEEECSGNGALACINAGYDADAVLIPESFGPTILTHQTGVLWFKVSIRGKPVHVKSAPSGTNAIEKSFPLIAALRRLEDELNRSDIPEAYSRIHHPLNLNIGVFKGGDWPSTVPAEAEFHARLSYFPGISFGKIRQRIIDVLEESARKDPWLQENHPEIEFYGFRSDGHALDLDLPAFQTLNACHRSLTGRDAVPYISTCTTDLRAFCLFGKGQATCYGPIAENTHGANERVRIESVLHTARVYALFLARWCGLVE